MTTMILDIASATEALAKGKLVAFPTETVYGLGADPGIPQAIQQLYRVKGRPNDHPVIIHIANMVQLKKVAIDIPPVVDKLAEAFWPGPLTLLLQKHPDISSQITGGRDTIAVRIPNHPVALELLKQYQKPLVAPSANKFGCISPTQVAHVMTELGSEIAGVLDGGTCEVGIESTILDLTQPECPKVLRPGMISTLQLEPFFKNQIMIPSLQNQIRQQQVSGSYPSHYAPRKATYLITTPNLENISLDAHTGLLAFSPPENFDGYCLPMMPEPSEYAYHLYERLRQLDAEPNINQIIIEQPPLTPVWDGIQDRLKKASAGKWFEV